MALQSIEDLNKGHFYQLDEGLKFFDHKFERGTHIQVRSITKRANRRATVVMFSECPDGEQLKFFAQAFRMKMLDSITDISDLITTDSTCTLSDEIEINGEVYDKGSKIHVMYVTDPRFASYEESKVVISRDRGYKQQRMELHDFIAAIAGKVTLLQSPENSSVSAISLVDG